MKEKRWILVLRERHGHYTKSGHLKLDRILHTKSGGNTTYVIRKDKMEIGEFTSASYGGIYIYLRVWFDNYPTANSLVLRD